MLNTIKAELYKYMHRPYMYVLVGILSFVISSVFLLLNFSGNCSKMYIIDKIIKYSFNLIILLIYLFVIVLSEEYKYGSMKNLMVSSTSKRKIFIGKFITESIIGIMAYFVIFIVFILCMSLLKDGVGYSAELYKKFLLKLIAMVPVLFGALAIANFWAIIIQKGSMAQITYFFSMILSENIIVFLSKTFWSKLKFTADWLIMHQVHWLTDNYATKEAVINGIWVGIITMVVFVLFSTIIFERREVK